MNQRNLRLPYAARQSGAALIIGLILLVVLTLLAVTGMNTASTELRMSGNEQFRKRAFELSEAGIERGVVQGPFLPDAPPQVVAPAPADGAAPDDLYSLLITSTGTTAPPPVPGMESSAVKFDAIHFTIQSLGESRRQGSTYQNAVATHLQGLYLISLSPDAG
jgi:type IV pilus assembly protein PilX